MGTLTLTFFFAVAVCSAALAARRLADLRASKSQSARLKPELAAVLANGDLSQVLALCDRCRGSSLARVVKEVIVRSDRIRGSEAARSEILRIFLNQAQAREAARLNRSSAKLRTVAFIGAPLGLMASACDTADALGFVTHCVPAASRVGSELGAALASAIAGLLLSIPACVLYE